jgi:hypothetical protein
MDGMNGSGTHEGLLNHTLRMELENAVGAFVVNLFWACGVE